MARLLTVHKKGYTRKPFTMRRGGKIIRMPATRVKASTFRIRDRGNSGRGPKLVPPLKEGALGGPGFFNRPRTEQKRIVFNRAKKIGERRVIGELRALQVFFKRTSKQKAARAGELSKQVAGSFIGKRQVTYPKGFRSKRSIA